VTNGTEGTGACVMEHVGRGRMIGNSDILPTLCLNEYIYIYISSVVRLWPPICIPKELYGAAKQRQDTRGGRESAPPEGGRVYLTEMGE
jgi:hypothetical protein